MSRSTVSRRDFIHSGDLVLAAFAARASWRQLRHRPPLKKHRRFGLATYTFRNFNRAQMIGFTNQLNVLAQAEFEVSEDAAD
jgi:hypothetical protein